MLQLHLIGGTFTEYATSLDARLSSKRKKNKKFRKGKLLRKDAKMKIF